MTPTPMHRHGTLDQPWRPHYISGEGENTRAVAHWRSVVTIAEPWEAVAWREQIGALRT